ncbi:class I SAM-dependent DNA methyltransferase [Kibdelosporangium persicum]|uniref:site-specific DNA-methyltransferase (adenine-specific) n=1 Tax=Kibdelosporangium persicum TaxID=2698649 RepID=A0ABX2FI42_9PSEU|nr:class I SAM-dependent DNA methyltransferase [Kibdelosporangium persicum]NRN71061.1 Type I restriction-modification system methyltransferase subunit [Kibdelosporangium persicum]
MSGGECRLTQAELETYLWGAAILLRGLIDAGDYKQYIFPLLFFKRISDVYDEERAAALDIYGDEELAARPENHRFQIPPGAHWDDVRRSPKNLGAALTKAMHRIESANAEQLTGVFGDAQWTNKDRLSDETLRNLIEHFSTKTLSIANVPEDELGQAYEYLVKKFADDSGHTAQEFYTNRTLVHLMVQMLAPKPGESVYDPTCGTGGMLVSAVAELKRQGKEHRNVRLFGQERNVMTSSIARMNLFLHGIEDFTIERGDTLADPKFLHQDRLRTFDVVLANPPYSIKQWDRTAFGSDKWGRKVWGVPPQGRADYAFFQHIVASLKPETGRCAILFPHGVLFRKEEQELREKLIRADILECVLGLGPGLFYNSPMEACVIICRTRKRARQKRKVLLINAVDQFARERSQSYLSPQHIDTILNAYQMFTDIDGFAKVVTQEEFLANEASLSIPLYISTPRETPIGSWDSLEELVADWDVEARRTQQDAERLINMLRGGAR